MKWNGLGQGRKGWGVKSCGTALTASLAIGLGMTACSRDYTVAYLYVPSSGTSLTSQGSINEYAVDYQSGALTPLATTGVSSGGNNPVGIVASIDQKHVWVINQNAPASNVVGFDIGTDGKLYPITGTGGTVAVVQNASGTVVGTNPTAIAIDSSGSFLYITFQYQAGYSPTSPGPGGVAVYPINASTGALGSPVMNGSLPYFPVGNNPVGVVVSPFGPNAPNAGGNYVYVIDQEKPANGTPYGVLLAFTRDPKTGALSQTPQQIGPVSGGFAAGTSPAGIAEDPGGHYLYVTDSTTNQLYGYGVLNTGSPLALNSSPYATGSFPEGITVDPRGEYVYVANYGSESVSAFAINSAGGGLSSVAGSAGTSVATGPTCVTIDPALGIYLYTSNYVDNSVSGLQLNPHTGALTPVQNAKFPAANLPTCAVAVGNGAHATQIVQ